jgi:hypothetical protein
MKILILDDDLARHKSFARKFIGHSLTHTETVEDCIEQLKYGNWDGVFLDHDLGGLQMVESGGNEPTGYDVAVWMNENPDAWNAREVYIHSFNPEGAARMQRLIPESYLTPGCWCN